MKPKSLSIPVKFLIPGIMLFMVHVSKLSAEDIVQTGPAPTGAIDPAVTVPEAADPGMTAMEPAATPTPVPPAPTAAPTTPIEETVVEDAPPTDPGMDEALNPLLPPPGVGQRTPTESSVINLINLLVERGVLTAADAAGLIRQAEEEAAMAQEQSVAIQSAAAQVSAAAEAELDYEADDVRVTYVPDYVRAQIRDELKEDVMEQARAENWAGVRSGPDWTQRITLFGDIRVRQENVWFPSGNDNTGAFPDFNTINNSAPFDTSGLVFSPQLNADKDRQRQRLRLRLGVKADVGSGFTMGVRLATGNNDSPVSANQTFAQSGAFTKYDVWVDRGFIRYENVDLFPNVKLVAYVGRFDNVFYTTEMVWDDDIGLDGMALQASYEVVDNVVPFVTAVFSPIYNTDFNFATNQPSKFESRDRYMVAFQGGIDAEITKDINVKFATAYYYFNNIRGAISDPFVPLSADDEGNTDNTRPLFAQKGNTYIPLRNIVPTAANEFGTINQFQYFGLASEFAPLTVTGRINFNHFEPYQITVYGEWVKNLAFKRSEIAPVAVNNRSALVAPATVGVYEGGDTGWIAGIKFGSPVMQKAFDWNIGFNYRYVETDAVIDGFTDSDFGLGGTNLKGYSVQGALALSPNVYIGLRWMSASEVTGPPFRSDILQFDISGKF